MIVCNRCGKENQPHYKFCLGCGAEITVREDGNVGTMKTMMADPGPRSPTPPAGAPLPGVGAAPLPGVAAYGGQRAPAGPPPGAPGFGGQAHGGNQTGQNPGTRPGGVSGGWGAQPAPGAPYAPQPVSPTGPIGMGPNAPGMAPGPRKCTECGTEIPPNFKFCGACGAAVAPAAAPAAAPAGAAPGGYSQPAPQAAPQPAATLTLIRPDGSEGGVFPLENGSNRVGRDYGSIFEGDGYLSPTHCEIVVQGRGAQIRDLDSLNGVFVRMTGEEEITPGQVIRLGQELLRYDLIIPPQPLDDGTDVMGSPNPGYWGKLTVIIGNDVDGSAYPLLNDVINLGRERGDINFPDDGYVSGLHARLQHRDGKAYLSDLGSSNGTFLRIQDERSIGNESFVLLGQQLFRLGIR